MGRVLGDADQHLAEVAAAQHAAEGVGRCLETVEDVLR